MALFNIFTKQDTKQEKGLSIGELKNLLSGNFISIDSESFMSNQLFDYYVGWVKVAVDRIADKVASVKFIVKDKKTGEVKNEHPLIDLLNKPNEFLTGFEFLERVVAYLEILGVSPVFINTKGVEVKGLYFIDPINLRVKKNNKGEPIGYELYSNDGKNVKKTYKLNEVIPFHLFSPYSFWDGVSNIEANKYTFSAMIELQKWMLAQFGTMMSPLAFVYNQRLTADEIERIKTQLRKKYSGSANAFEPLILGNDAKVQKIGLSPKDLDLSQTEGMIRDKVLGLFGVPKTIAGIVEDVNKASAITTENNFLKHVITPKVRRIVAYLNTYLVDVYFDDVVLDFEPLVKEDKWEKVKTLVSATGRPIITINEARAILGFEPVEGGDVVFEPMQTLENNQIEEKEQKDNTDKEEIKEVAKLKEEIKELKGALTERMKLDMISAKKYKQALKHELVFKKLFKEYAKDYIKRIRERLHSIPTLNVGGYIQKGLVEIETEADAIRFILMTFAKYLNDEMRKDAIEIFGDAVVPNLNVERLYNKAIKKKAKKIAETIGKTTIKEIQAGFEAGESIAEIVKRLNKVEKFITYEEAERVARTETTYLSNDITDRMYNEMGVDKRVWIAVGDSRTRDDHMALHGQVRSRGEPFVTPSGVQLKRPGDPDAPIEEIVNCRCRLVADV